VTILRQGTWVLWRDRRTDIRKNVDRLHNPEGYGKLGEGILRNATLRGRYEYTYRDGKLDRVEKYRFKLGEIPKRERSKVGRGRTDKASNRGKRRHQPKDTGWERTLSKKNT